LISFLFWMVYNTVGKSDTLDPMGFVVFRIIRYVNLHKVFKLTALQEDIDIYVNTLKLAYTSSGAVMVLLVFTIFLFSLLMYVFERGLYNMDNKRWERDADEGESPFADMSSCIYFVLVTMTTLGYGDLYPKTYVGRMVAMITVFVGLCNITFLINIVGDCFEEVFREFVVKRSKKMENEHSKYLTNCVHEVQTQKSGWLFFHRENKRLRNLKLLAKANEREFC
jgi:potassium voltage-gated channel Shaw-related subfamily C protein 3